MSPSRELSFRVSPEQGGARLDRLIAEAAQVSRRVARTLIASGRVSVNQRPMRILTRPIKSGALVQVMLDAVATEQPSHDVGVLFVDRYVVFIDKPAGLLSEHDRFGSPSLESVVPEVLRARGERDTRLWLVHRLDAGTSGVIVMARTPMAVKELGEAFRAGTVSKRYLALCRGELAEAQTVEAPIGRAQGTRHAVRPDGKPAQTEVRPLAHNPQGTLVAAEPRTGRTHQIRVHLAHLGHPLWGDRLYGGPVYTEGPSPEPIGRPMLHAARLAIRHPKTGEQLTIETPPPADFQALVQRLGLSWSQKELL